jgi:acyl-coenzyme A thioesterase PaaI-like protein
VASFGSWLGFTRGVGAHQVVLETRVEHEVVPGMIHFAVLTTLGEVAAAAAVEAAVVPAAVQAQLVARARPGTLTATGTLLRRGSRIAFARGEVVQDGKLVAAVDVTFALV